MQIQLQFEAQLRQAAGCDRQNLDLADSAVVLDAVQQAAESGSDSLRSRLLSSDGKLQAGILVFVNEHPVQASQVNTHLLQDGDVVLLLPPISGG